jgi:hypothetical protein
MIKKNRVHTAENLSFVLLMRLTIGKYKDVDLVKMPIVSEGPDIYAVQFITSL